MATVSANRPHPFSKRTRRLASGRKNHSGSRIRNRFLTAKLQRIPGYAVSCNSAFACDRPDRCIAYLVQSLRCFYKEYAIPCELPEITGYLPLDLKALYGHLCEHIPNKDWKVECVRTTDKDRPFRFVVSKEIDNFPYYSIWSIPVKKLSQSDEQTRKLLMLTFAMLHKEDLFEFPKDSYDFQYALGQAESESWWKEVLEVDMDALDQWDTEFADWTERYVVGDIYRLFAKIHSVERETENCHEEVLKLVKALRKTNYSDGGLLSAIEDVAEMCKKGWLTDFHTVNVREIYGDDFVTSNIGEDDNGMDFFRMFSFCYELDDPIVDYLVEVYNQCNADMDLGILMNHSFIDDPDVKINMENTYPAEWVVKMGNLIRELE